MAGLLSPASDACLVVWGPRLMCDTVTRVGPSLRLDFAKCIAALRSADGSKRAALGMKAWTLTARAA